MRYGAHKLERQNSVVDGAIARKAALGIATEDLAREDAAGVSDKRRTTQLAHER
jgi:hypothetical protein